MTVTAPPAMVAYWEPKEASDRGSWEDGVSYDPLTGWFAIADGASTASRSREWAFHLTDSHRVRPFSLEGSAEVVAHRFHSWVATVRHEFDPEASTFASSETPLWVQSASRERGAHATFLAGRIHEGRLQAVAYGDCCLFHLRNDETIRPFPASSKDDFGSSPDLVTSLERQSNPEAKRVRFHEAPYERGDALLVCSDALAEWLIGCAGDPDVLNTLLRVGAQEFRRLVIDLRGAGLMKNDDVTMLRIVEGA